MEENSNITIKEVNDLKNMVTQLQHQVQNLKLENETINLKLQITTDKEKELINKLTKVEEAIENSNTTNNTIISTIQDLKQDLKQTIEKSNNEITFKVESKFQIIQDAIHKSIFQLTRQAEIKKTIQDEFKPITTTTTTTNNNNNISKEYKYVLVKFSNENKMDKFKRHLSMRKYSIIHDHQDNYKMKIYDIDWANKNLGFILEECLSMYLNNIKEFSMTEDITFLRNFKIESNSNVYLKFDPDKSITITNGANVEMSNLNMCFSEHTAYTPFRIDSDSVLNFKNGSFENNSFSHGIFSVISRSSLDLDNVRFKENILGKNLHGFGSSSYIMSQSGGKINIKNCTFSDLDTNYSSIEIEENNYFLNKNNNQKIEKMERSKSIDLHIYSIYATESNFVMQDSKFINASQIYLFKSDAVITNCNFSDMHQGAARGPYLNISDSRNLKIENSCFENNVNLDSYGGALYIYEERINKNKKMCKIKDSTFRGNSAKYGGAIYANGSKISFENCMFENNNALKAGGAIAVANGALCDMEGTCRFVGNNAPRDNDISEIDLANPFMAKNKY